MARQLTDKKIAILVADGFEQVELIEPKRALEHSGAQTQIISPGGEKVKGWNFTNWGDDFKVDVPLGNANPDDYDALIRLCQRASGKRS